MLENHGDIEEQALVSVREVYVAVDTKKKLFIVV